MVKGLKLILRTPVLASHKTLLKDFTLPNRQTVAFENYLELTEVETASITIPNGKDNLKAKLKYAVNNEINLKKVDKETTTVIMNTKLAVSNRK